jgi:glycosyltransferase involved in cell wall biosynthesis
MLIKLMRKIYTSKFLMPTRPLRFLKKYLTAKGFNHILNKLFHLIELVWRHIPLTDNQKRRLMNILLKSLPSFFSWYRKYGDRKKQRLGASSFGNQQVISKVFDGVYYLSANPDIAAAGIDPLQHFCKSGWQEGRNPHPLFSTIYYLQRYPDVMKAGINPLEHYLCRGWLEGRDPHPAFDTAYYTKAGWYSTKCGISPLEYYLQHRCAATATQLAGFDALLPRLQDDLPSSFSAHVHSMQPENAPLISIIMPTYNTPSRYLEACIDSVLTQSYVNWELCITDDGSISPETRDVLERYSLLDSRIRVKWLEINSGISAATNDALNRTSGEFVAMLDSDDTLEPDALLDFVHEINCHPNTDAIYSDQDRITAEGERFDTYFKPDWSPELLRGVMYVGHLLMVRRSLALDIGGFDSTFDWVQDFEFMLRVGENTDHIRHIPKILYHWRIIPGSNAYDGDAKGKLEPVQCASVNAHMARLGLAGQAVPHPVIPHRALVTPRHDAAPQSITVIIGQITNRVHLNKCLDSLIGKGFETEVLLFAGSNVPLSRPGLRIMSLPPVSSSGNENVGAMQLFNIALKEARGEYVLFMEKPMILSSGWAERLALYAGRPAAGLVSPLVLNADGTVAEAGLILHPRRGIEPAMSGWEADGDGQAGSLSCAREVSAVSASCVCFRKSVLREIGGLDPLYWSFTFQIADASLKAMSLGMCNLYVPTVTAMHCAVPPEDNAVDEFLDRELFLDRWCVHINDGDRYHNPNYSPDKGGYVSL